MTECYFAQYDNRACDFWPRLGPDRAHLIRRQRIKRERPELDDMDPVLIVPGCRRHHHLFDQGLLVLEEADYPSALREWATINRFYYREGQWRAAK